MPQQNIGGAMMANVPQNATQLTTVYEHIESLFYRAGEVNSRNDILTSMTKHALYNCTHIAKIVKECVEAESGGAEEYQRLMQVHTWLMAKEIERGFSDGWH